MVKTKFKFLVDGIAYLDNLERNIDKLRAWIEEEGFIEVNYFLSMGVSSVLFTLEYKEKEPLLEELDDEIVIDLSDEVVQKPRNPKKK